MNSQQVQAEVSKTRTAAKQADYSLCRASCSVCPYRQGLLKLLDHGNTIVPTLPVREDQ